MTCSLNLTVDSSPTLLAVTNVVTRSNKTDLCSETEFILINGVEYCLTARNGSLETIWFDSHGSVLFEIATHEQKVASFTLNYYIGK